MGVIEELQSQISQFCSERDWDQFHSPKDLAIGAVTEASELLELFRFKSNEEISKLMADPKFREKAGDEVADVFFFVLRFCQMNGINLEENLKRKMARNAEKYPVEKARGSNKKYDDL